MAKKWFPTQRQLSMYDELVKKQNAVRKHLKKIYKNTEAESRSNPRLPSIVIPKRAISSGRINWRRLGRENFKKQLKAMRELYGRGADSYLSQFKKNFLRAFIDALGIKPEGAFKRFSPEQITEARGSEGDYMELYNQFQQMSPTQFFDMYNKGFVVQFKYIYQEIQGAYKENSFLDEQEDMLKQYRRILRTNRTPSNTGKFYGGVEGGSLRQQILENVKDNK